MRSSGQDLQSTDRQRPDRSETWQSVPGGRELLTLTSACATTLDVLSPSLYPAVVSAQLSFLDAFAGAKLLTCDLRIIIIQRPQN